MNSEFDLIRRYFAPLTSDTLGAFGLTDDAATLSPSEGCELVVTMDTVLAGVHFLIDELPKNVVAKLIGSNLSDLAAMGARPVGFTVSCSWPREIEEPYIAAFVEAMSDWISDFSFPLLGGDTVITDGPASFTLTAIGEVPMGAALRRNGATPGDGVFVTGSIGDGALGLLAARAEIEDLSDEHAAFLADRYRRPRPRIAAGQALVGIASSCIDISDGLIQDLGHIASTSGVGIEIEADLIPLSDAAREVITWNPDLAELIYGGGDDYELAFTSAGEVRETNVPIARIGTVISGEGVQLLGPGHVPIPVERTGFSHL